MTDQPGPAITSSDTAASSNHRRLTFIIHILTHAKAKPGSPNRVHHPKHKALPHGLFDPLSARCRSALFD